MVKDYYDGIKEIQVIQSIFIFFLLIGHHHAQEREKNLQVGDPFFFYQDKIVACTDQSDFGLSVNFSIRQMDLGPPVALHFYKSTSSYCASYFKVSELQ